MTFIINVAIWIILFLIVCLNKYDGLILMSTNNEIYKVNCNNDRIRYCMRVMYDGTRFHGFQEQKNVRTIQRDLSKALSKRFDHEIKVSGASRTDQLVHARGQVVHFDLPFNIAKQITNGIDEILARNDNNIYEIYNNNNFIRHNIENKKNLEKLTYTLNRMLNNDIQVYNASVAPEGKYYHNGNKYLWHARKSATKKLYTYSFCTNEFVDPLKRNYCSHFYRPFDHELFVKCLNLFVGQHDFNAFANRIEHSNNDFKEKYPDYDSEFSTIKTIYSIDYIDEGNGYYKINVLLKGALYRMVRNIVGSALAASLHEKKLLTYEKIKDLLIDAPSRNENKALSAPPEGLCLEYVYYDDY